MHKNGVLEKHDLNTATLSFNDTGANGLGLCTLCGKKSENKCDRCGDYYCSDICQRKDWPNHRYICFPIPKLVKVGQCSVPKSDNIKKEPLVVKDATATKNTNLPPNGSCVLLTGFKSSNRCYIRSTNPSAVSDYEKILNEIDEYGKKSSVLTEKPKTNSYALALKGGKWCRVQVVGSNRDICRIFFIDFGDICKRSYKDMRKIDPSLVNLPCSVHMVQLKSISNYSIQAKLLNSLTQYTNKEYKVEFVKPDNVGGNVELFFWGTSKLLNSLIQELSNKHKDNDKDTDRDSVGSSPSNVDLENNEMSNKNEAIGKTQPNSKPGLKRSPQKKIIDTKTSKETNITNKNGTNDANDELHVVKPNENKRKTAPVPRQIQKPCLEPPFEINPLNEDDRNCKVLIVDNSYIESGYIGCILEKYRENFAAIAKFLQDLDVGDQSYKPKLDEYCLAKYENEWYRAKAVEILSEDKFLVVYIDFTNEMELTSNSIRRYPMSLNLPCCTTFCIIDGLPDVSDEIQKFLEQNCTVFSALNIDSVRIVDDVPHIKSNELLKKMTKLL